MQSALFPYSQKSRQDYKQFGLFYSLSIPKITRNKWSYRFIISLIPTYYIGMDRKENILDAPFTYYPII